MSVTARTCRITHVCSAETFTVDKLLCSAPESALVHVQLCEGAYKAREKPKACVAVQHHERTERAQPYGTGCRKEADVGVRDGRPADSLLWWTIADTTFDK